MGTLGERAAAFVVTLRNQEAAHEQVDPCVVRGQMVGNRLQGIAQRGLLVRHLVLPENIAGTDKVLAFLAEEISTNTYLNLMDQYYPCYRADENTPLGRPLSSEEYRSALALARQYGISRLDKRQQHVRLTP